MSAEKVAATPGPWTIQYGAIWGIHRSCECDEEYVCKPWGRTPAEIEANARLIVSAPDLLALAKRYASECGMCGGTGLVSRHIEGRDTQAAMDADDHPCEACADIRAVIEKAEGRA